VRTLPLLLVLLLPAAPVRASVPAEVEATVRADTRVATAALWSDAVPAGAARVLAGPALAALRTAAAARRREGLRLRLLSSQLSVVSLRPLHGGAIEVVARWSQLLVPTDLDGVPRGGQLRLVEQARLLLRHPLRERRLVVWKVVLAA